MNRSRQENRRWLLRFALLAILASVASSLLGAPSARADSHEAPSAAGRPSAIEPDELAGFVDGLFAQHLEEYDIPGGIFVMVRDGEIVLARGYGYADLEKQTPVDPERTLFDIGSVTKLFTATAVMQLVEQGRLDLEADVNEYLTAFQVPATFDEPITLAHLLTHTSGLDDRFFLGMVAPSPDAREPLGENLARHLPPRVRPPGEVVDYSNFGIALAGHLVEQVSGQSFAEYVRAQILEPLGMERTGFDVPSSLAKDAAIGYGGFGQQVEALEPWHLNHLPAGGLRTSATDIAAFMMAHLNGGRLEDGRMLEAATVEEMQRAQFRSHPAVSGMGYGFFEHMVGGRRAVQHGGDWVGTAALLYLLPEEKVGFFAAYNSGSGAVARTKLIEALLDRYYPVPSFTGSPIAGDAERGRLFEGDYRLLRQDDHSFLRLPAMLLNVSLDVRSQPDGTLTTSMSRSPLLPEPLVPDARWVETDPGVFRESGGTNTLAFDLEHNEAGRLHLYWPQPFSMERVGWYRSTGLQLGLLAILVVGMLTALVGWPAGFLYRRLRNSGRPTSTEQRVIRVLSGAVGGLLLVFILGFAVMFATDTPGLLQIPPTLTALLVLPLIAASLTAALGALVVRMWVGRHASLGSLVYHTVVTLLLVAAFPYLYYWGLLGFRY